MINRFFSTFFTKSHHWLQFSKDSPSVTFGLTNYAQKSLGDAVYIEILPVNSKVKQNESIGIVESVKSATDINAPIDGRIFSINESVVSKPSLLNQDPEKEGWLCQIQPTQPTEQLAKTYGLLSFSDYQKLCQTDETVE